MSDTTDDPDRSQVALLSGTPPAELPDDTTPTAKLVFLWLQLADEPQGYDDLEEKVDASERALSTAVADLRTAGVVISRPDPLQPSRVLHELAESDGSTD